MILLFPGCLYTHKLKNILSSYENLLKKLKVDYIKINDLKCCGSSLRCAGYQEDFKRIAKENVDLINKHKVTEIITLCPHCNRLFEKQYKKYAGLSESIKISFVTNFVLDKVKQLPEKGVVTYQDSCFLGRRSGFYAEPRELITKLGYSVVEPENTREELYCCGGGGNVRENNRELSEAVAQTRVNEFTKTKTRVIVTNCPHCYVCLSGKGMTVKDVSELAI